MLECIKCQHNGFIVLQEGGVMAGGVVDPRTGEIIKGHVVKGSLRGSSGL